MYKRHIITIILALAALVAPQTVHGQTVTLVGQVQDVFLKGHSWQRFLSMRRTARLACWTPCM